MEESISKDDQPQPTCPICLQLFSEPMSLPCGHSFCLVCIQTIAAGLDQHSCPECQEHYEGTSALVKNFQMCGVVEAFKATLGSRNLNVDSPSVIGAKANDSSPIENTEVKYHQEVTTSIQSQGESSTCHSKGQNKLIQADQGDRQEGSQTGLGSSDLILTVRKQQSVAKTKTELDEPKFRLASQVTELTLRLEMAECALRKEKEWEDEARAANAQLRGRTAKLLEAIGDLSLKYGKTVTRLVEEQLCPDEGSLSSRVSRASELTRRLRQAALSAESLLTEEDEAAFNEDLRHLQPRIAELIGEPSVEAERAGESNSNATLACSKLEEINLEFKAGIGEIHRSIRNVLNPSEVTFDRETAHPNLVLSDDLKTVTYSGNKQVYPSSPQRFVSFFQVLSSQSFFGGEHCWRVELEGSPWVIGVCYSGQLKRVGMPSALESSRGSWCLMWFENQLRAFEQGHDTPLKKTTLSRKLEIRLSFKTHRLSFYNVSANSGNTHIYTFKADLTEPVHLAYRMMSGHPKARVTIC